MVETGCLGPALLYPYALKHVVAFIDGAVAIDRRQCPPTSHHTGSIDATLDSRTTSSTSMTPPSLPPRPGGRSTALSPNPDAPPPSSSIAASSKMSSSELWTANDPRSSSTQSLVPSESNAQNERRKLLLIYIHGFMGNETSFRSFPAHVHNLVTVLLAATHVVHTKIYPRYRSKRNISFARDDFSKWLAPHEDVKTDVILLGHSMGGLLSAEVALMGPPAPANRPLKHRILGTINFDVPFLGMHPGVVKSGLASIFKSSDEQGDHWSPEISPVPSQSDTESISTISTLGSPHRNDTLWHPSRSDPNLNPSFANDVILPMRTGWRNALHFVHKHSGNIGELTKATKQLVSSHLEFGGAMANYPELRTRYYRVRALEEGDEGVRKGLSGMSNEVLPRVRFVNYYTASTGHVKRNVKSPHRLLSPGGSQSRVSLSPSVTEADARGRQENGSVRPASARSRSPQISLEEFSEEGVLRKEPDLPSSGDEDWEEAAESLTIDDPPTSVPLRKRYEDVTPVLSPASTLSRIESLPPLPELPSAPPPLDVSYIQDADTRKLVEKEHVRAVTSYEKAVKDREEAVKDRAKFEAKRASKEERAARKTDKDERRDDMNTQQQEEELRLEKERQRMEAEARRLKGEASPPVSQPVFPEQAPSLSTQPSTTSSPSTSRSRSRSPSASASDKHKPKRDHKFCTLPPKDSRGERDATWVRVFMENVDEVGAHCGLFFVDERYERLVGDVAGRVEEWVREDGDRRVAAGAEGEGS